jgi:hypothetical protein
MLNSCISVVIRLTFQVPGDATWRADTGLNVTGSTTTVRALRKRTTDQLNVAVSCEVLTRLGSSRVGCGPGQRPGPRWVNR